MRFYFNYRKHDCLLRDPEGSELPDEAAATDEAIYSARELMASAVRDGRDISDEAFEVVDERQVVLLRVPFRMALRRPKD